MATRPRSKKKHKDVEFHVSRPRTDTQVFDNFPDAAVRAIGVSASDGRPVFIDVVVLTRAGARWWSGDWGADEYDEDPDASVFDRIVVSAESQGRIA